MTYTFYTTEDTYKVHNMFSKNRFYETDVKIGVVKAYGASKAETIKRIEYWKRRSKFERRNAR